VGKYTLHGGEAYKSVVKALTHSAVEAQVKVRLVWIEASDLLDPAASSAASSSSVERHRTAWAGLRGADGLLVPGGFGARGVDGMCEAVRHARTAGLPFFGICLGMQCAVIEYARNVLGWTGANSTEFDEATPHPVVVHMPEIDADVKGGNMRLGARTTRLVGGDDCIAAQLYQGHRVLERHRHRYEVNPHVVSELEQAGLAFTGQDDTGTRMEIVELPRSAAGGTGGGGAHPFFFGVQYHPEFKSRPHSPSPAFTGFVHACMVHKSAARTKPEGDGTEVDASGGARKLRVVPDVSELLLANRPACGRSGSVSPMMAVVNRRLNAGRPQGVVVRASAGSVGV